MKCSYHTFLERQHRRVWWGGGQREGDTEHRKDFFSIFLNSWWTRWRRTRKRSARSWLGTWQLWGNTQQSKDPAPHEVKDKNKDKDIGASTLLGPCPTDQVFSSWYYLQRGLVVEHKLHLKAMLRLPLQPINIHTPSILISCQLLRLFQKVA